VLLLDEPTNHLDLDMREALAEALADFDGAIVLVSHDRHLIGLVCETFWRVADGRVESFKGDLDEYAVWLGARANKSAEPSPEPAAPKARPKPRPDLQTSRRQQQLATLEQKLQGLAMELAALEKDLADPFVYEGRRDELTRLVSRHATVRDAHGALEAEWLELYGQLEAS
jgi:ATP-binding cassette subfamily F protein 3